MNHYTFMGRSDKSGLDMLLCRQQSSLPPERQQWGSPVQNAEHDTQVVHEQLSQLGQTGILCERLQNGDTVSVVDYQNSLSLLHSRFAYALRVGTEVGGELMGQSPYFTVESTAYTMAGITPDEESHLEGLNAYNWALCVIKPDAKLHGMESTIEQEIERRGLAIRAKMAERCLTLAMLDQLWPAPLDANGQPLPPSPWWAATIDYMTSAPVDVLLVSGRNVSTQMKDLKANLRTNLYGSDYQQNQALPYSERVRSVIHTSDNNREFITNVGAFWTSEELEKITREKC